MAHSHTPLADRIRPKTLSEFIGQNHLVGKNGIIRQMIESDQLTSMIFWGPPGSGKTTLARVIANTTKSHFLHHSAVATTLKDVRMAVKEAKERLGKGRQLSLSVSRGLQRTIFFLDEIHRFNKAQQDAFLPHVEDGTIILIGATTENPSFEVIGPLLSRSRVFVLNQLNQEELKKIIERGLKELKIKISDDAIEFLIQSSNGDARIVLNALELASKLLFSKRVRDTPGVGKDSKHLRGGRVKSNVTSDETSDSSEVEEKGKQISLPLMKKVFQKETLLYDRAGEEHYNTISSYIKSMRASNADAALYYLARMVEAGEDPLFIARRMVIFASEDIGMAQPTALVVANEVFRACETIGYPECAINLAHGTVYLAKAPKDRSAYNGLRAAQEDVKKHGNLPIPLHLRNPVTKLMKEIGYGKGYEKYTKEDLLPVKLKGKKYYKPN